jgi:hypothetical protein
MTFDKKTRLSASRSKLLQAWHKLEYFGLRESIRILRARVKRKNQRYQPRTTGMVTPRIRLTLDKAIADRAVTGHACGLSAFLDDNRYIRWHRAMPGNLDWPLCESRCIDYGGPQRLGDIRSTWEPNRLQWVVQLLSEGCIESVFSWRIIEDWILQNPYGAGPNWCQAQEAALRLISMSWLWRIADPIPAYMAKSLKQSVIDHVRYVLENMSVSFVTHNHIITEAAGLFIAAMTWPNWLQSEKRIQNARHILEMEADKQLWENGPSGEGSTGYHCFVLESLLQVCILGRKQGVPFSPSFEKKVERAIEYVMHLLRPDGSIPLLGDNDGGRAMWHPANEWDDRRAYLAVGSFLFDRIDFAFVAGRYYAETDWLLESPMQRQGPKPSAKKPALSAVYPEMGVSTSRSSWGEKAHYLVIRGGATLDRPFVGKSHNHADPLSFEYWFSGEPVFVDPGTYLYSGPDEWRRLFRETAAHNTVVMDGKDRYDITRSRFDVSAIRPSAVEVGETQENLKRIAFIHSQSGIEHRRTWMFHLESGELVVTDDFQGGDSCDLEWNFLCAPGIRITTGNPTILQTRHNEIAFQFEPINEAEVKVTSGIGWLARKYGEKIETTKLSVRCRLNESRRFGFKLAGVRAER